MRILARIVLLAVLVASMLSSAASSEPGPVADEVEPGRPELPAGPPDEWVLETQLESTVRIRERLGLNSDERLVAELLVDEEARRRGLRWGIAITAVEEVELVSRVQAEERRAALLEALYVAYEDEFSGSRIGDDGVLEIFLKIGFDPAPLESILGGDDSGLQIRVTEVRRSHSDVLDLQQEIQEKLAEFGVIDVIFYDRPGDVATVHVSEGLAEMDRELETVELSAPPAAVRLVPSAYSDETDEPGYGYQTFDPGHPCRPAHCSPIVGGQFYSCTVGFAVQAIVGSWGRGLSSAGHCTDPGDTVFRYRWVSESGTWNSGGWWRLDSWSAVPGAALGDSVDDAISDIGYHDVSDRLISNNYFQEDAVHWRTVTGVRYWYQLSEGSQGTRVCASWGRQEDAPQCGRVADRGAYIFSVNLDDPDLSVGGDSGSPYWLESSPWIAVGSHVGGDGPVNATSVSALYDVLDTAVLTNIDRERDFYNGLYGHALNRHADSGGFAHWTGLTCNLTNLRSGINNFYRGGEFVSKYDTDSFDSLNHVRTVLRKLYRGALGREPDPAGLTAWANHIWAGGTDQARQDRWDGAVWGFATSPEFTSRFTSGAAGEAGHGLCAS